MNAVLTAARRPPAWARGPARPHVTPGTVDVWSVPLPPDAEDAEDITEVTGYALSVLDRSELDRARRLARPRDTAAYLTTHAALRDILGRYLAADPARVRFSLGRHGKPFLDGPGLAFNLSHTAGRALVAVTRPGPVGVDIERATDVPPERHAALAARLFAPAEAAAVDAAARRGDPSAFFSYWVCKESYLKALGVGLSRPLDSFEVRRSPHDDASAGIWCGGRRRAGWRVATLRLPHDDYAAAVCVRGPLTRLRTWSWRPPTHDTPRTSRKA